MFLDEGSKRMMSRDIELDYIDMERLSEVDAARSRTKFDLDELLASTYTLYTHRGLTSYVISHVCSFLIEIILAVVLFFLILVIDWDSIIRYQSTSTDTYIYEMFRWPRLSTGALITIILAFTLPIVVRCIFDIGEFLFMKCINAELLSHGIDLTLPKFAEQGDENTGWKALAIELSSITARPVSTEDEKLENDLEIRVRLLRRETYKVAILTDANIEIPTYTKPVEWVLEYALWDYIFYPSSGHLRRPHLNEDELAAHTLALQRRLNITMWMSIIFAPLIFIYYLLYSILAFAQQVRITPSLATQRVWSTEALLYYRNYNELPHEFNERMNLAAGPASKFLNSRYDTTLEPIIRVLLFMVTTVAITLFFLTLINGDLLTNVTVWSNTTVLYFLGFLTIVVGFLQSLLPNSFESARKERYWKKMQAHLQLPEHVFCDAISSKKLLGSHFVPAYKKWLTEILSILITPYVCIKLQPQIGKILTYLNNHTFRDNKAGVACSKSIWEKDVLSSVRLDGALTNKKLATSMMLYMSRQ